MKARLNEIRYAGRQLRKSPGFAITAVLTLALGIGANIAVFSVMNAVLLNPSGIPHPDSVVALRARYNMGDLANIGISAPDFGDAQDGTQIFSSGAVLQPGNYTYSGTNATPEQLIGGKVSWRWFDVFEARPVMGRVFRAEEDQPNANREVILSYATWKGKFGGDHDIVGKKLLLNQENYEVIGVMGPEFAQPNQAQLWTPIGLPPDRYHDRKFRFNENLFGVARLKPGVTVAQANSYLQLKARQEIAAEGKDAYGNASGWSMFSMPLVEFYSGTLRKPLTVLLAAVGLVLLIACANIAGLQLARASDRQREVSIRIALGANRAGLMRQAFTESMLLAVAGVVGGLALARVAIPLLLLLAPPGLSKNIGVHIQTPVLLFVAAAGVFCALLCGVAPAWQMTRVRWFQSLQESGRSEMGSRSRQRLRSALVVGEIALAMLLLVAAGLLVRSLQQLERVDTGFDPQNLATAMISLPSTTYKADAQQGAFFYALLGQLRSAPGVEDAAVIDSVPFGNGGGMQSFAIKGRNQGPNDPGPHGNVRIISPQFFSTMKIPLLRGRGFSDGDRSTTEQVAMIDDVLAKQYWPNEDAIGQHINIGTPGKDPWITIVGIAKHARSNSLEADLNEGFYFLPIAQVPTDTAAVIVRSRTSHPENLTAAIQAAVRAVDPNQPIYNVSTMEQRVDDSLIGRRFLVVLLSIFAALALLLAAIGLYGVIHYGVKLRIRELGIRMALGAARGDVLRLVLAQGVRLAVIGLVIGVVATFVFGRTLGTLLYQVKLFNAPTLLLTSLLLMTTVLIASYVPARRASRLDPMRTLRDE